MKTTISVSREIRDKLAELGKKDDSFDDILVRILNKIDDDEDERKNS
jgi:predicted CopG family antitoxin